MERRKEERSAKVRNVESRSSSKRAPFQLIRSSILNYINSAKYCALFIFTLDHKLARRYKGSELFWYRESNEPTPHKSVDYRAFH